MRVYDPQKAAHRLLAGAFPDAQVTECASPPSDVAVLTGAVSETQVRRACEAARQVFVCCPDGGGEGRRAYRSIDLATLLLRYGRFTHMAPTDDGKIVAGITPVRRRGDIAIWTGWAIGPWHPTDITTRGLGGSETAAWRLAEELAKMDYTVTLYGQFEESGLVGDVMLRDFRVFDPTAPLDAFIGFRDAGRFNTPINARSRILWLEDVPGNEQLTRQAAGNIDHVCCVSRWHQQAFRERYPWLDPAVVHQCRNGITPEFFHGPAPERNRRVLYTSSPDRGLDVVLKVWPRIREQVPDAELLSTYSRWYDIVSDHYPKAFEHRKLITDQVAALEDQGVRRVTGGMGQRDLAHLMRASMVWVHPSWYMSGDRPFDETSCISAMEAQAAGCVIVAAAQGALNDTVRVGELIPDPSGRRDEAWQDQFVDHIVRGLTDEWVQQHAQEAGPDAVKDCDWRGAAELLCRYIPVKAPGKR